MSWPSSIMEINAATSFGISSAGEQTPEFYRKQEVLSVQPPALHTHSSLKGVSIGTTTKNRRSSAALYNHETPQISDLFSTESSPLIELN